MGQLQGVQQGGALLLTGREDGEDVQEDDQELPALGAVHLPAKYVVDYSE